MLKIKKRFNVVSMLLFASIISISLAPCSAYAAKTGLSQADLSKTTPSITVTNYSPEEILELEETVYDLKEGIYHDGTGSVIRFLGRKK